MFEKLNGWIWIDGEFVPCQDAKIHLITNGFHYGTAVFEGIRSYDGVIFKAHEHFDRLKKSANILNFDITFDSLQMIQITQQLLEMNQLKDAYIRPIAWCGTDSMRISPLGLDIHLAIATWVWTETPPENGVRLIVSPWRRPDPRSAPVKAKATGLYTLSSLAKADAQTRGFDDALMLDCDGNIAESTVSNIFFVQNGRLYTPPPVCFLDGITRQTIIQIAKDLNIEVIEKIMTLDDLNDDMEAFLTGTALEIQKIYSIANQEQIWNLSSHDLTDRILAEFHKMTRGHSKFFS